VLFKSVIHAVSQPTTTKPTNVKEIIHTYSEETSHL